MVPIGTMMNTITHAISGSAGSAARSGWGPMRPDLRAPTGFWLDWLTRPLLEPLALWCVEDHAVRVAPLHRDRLPDAPRAVLEDGGGILDLEEPVALQANDQGRAAPEIHEVLELPAESLPVRGDPQLLGPDRHEHPLTSRRGPGERLAEAPPALHLDGRTAAGALANRARKQIAHADEVRDEGRPRPVVDVARRRQLDDPAAIHDRDQIGHREGFFLIVRHVDERDAHLAVHALQLELHLLAELEVERAERLVEEKDGRVVDERARQRDPLLLAAGQLVGPSPIEAPEPNLLERLPDGAPDLGGRPGLDAQPERDVLEDGQLREECVVLEDRVDVPPIGRDTVHALAP